MKVAIIGLGTISPMHINGLINAHQNIVGLCDIDIDKCKAKQKEYNLNCKIYSDYKKMLDELKPEVVHICTPHYLHADMICESLQRDINVLTEKPLAINFEQLNKIEINLKKSKANLGVCFQNRFNLATLYVRDFLKDKKIVSASANLIWKRDKAYYESAEWRGKKATEGGGVMINQAIHALDFMQSLCGMPKYVTANISNNSLKGVIDVEDTAFGLFELNNESNFIINATNCAKYAFPVYYMFRTENDVVELTNDNIIINNKFITKSDGLPLYGKEVWGVGHINLIENFYECLQKGVHFPIDFYEGAKVIKLILAMYQSNGTKIQIKE